MPERSVLSSLIGTAAPLLTVETSDPQELEYCSAFLPRNWAKTTPFLVDDIIIGPNNPTNFGVDMTFEIPKLATVLTDIVVRSELQPATVVPAGNTASYNDFPGFAMWDEIRMIFGSNVLFTIQAYDLYIKWRTLLNIERQEAIRPLILADSSTAFRSNFLLTGGQLLTPLWIPFSLDTAGCYPLIVLAQKTRFILRTNT